MPNQRKCVDCGSNLNFELVDGGCRNYSFTCTNGTAVDGYTSDSDFRHNCLQGSCAAGSRNLGADSEGRDHYCCLRFIPRQCVRFDFFGIVQIPT